MGKKNMYLRNFQIKKLEIVKFSIQLNFKVKFIIIFFFLKLNIIFFKDVEEAQWMNENELSMLKEDIEAFNKKNDAKSNEKNFSGPASTTNNNN